MEKSFFGKKKKKVFVKKFFEKQKCFFEKKKKNFVKKVHKSLLEIKRLFNMSAQRCQNDESLRPNFHQHQTSAREMHWFSH